MVDVYKTGKKLGNKVNLALNRITREFIVVKSVSLDDEKNVNEITLMMGLDHANIIKVVDTYKTKTS